MSENFDQVPRDDSDVYLEDGFGVGASEALIPRFEQAKAATPSRKPLAPTKESGRAGALMRIPANAIRRKGSGEGKARSPN